LKKWVPLINLILASISNVHAVEVRIPKFLYCRDVESVGLFQQCQDAILQKDGPEKAEVYLIPTHHVEIIPKKNLFMARPLQENESLAADEIVGISSSMFGDRDSSGFQNLCQAEGKVQKLIRVSCGAFKKETISPAKIFRLIPVSKKISKPTV
jgi:hypothetical protein